MRKALKWQLALLVVAVALIAMTSAFAYSQATGSSSSVKACYDPGASRLRAVGSVTECGRTESPIDWNQVKSQGSVILSSGQTSLVRIGHPGQVAP